GLDEQRNAVAPWAEIPTHLGKRWFTHIAHDFGSSAPSVTQVMTVSPGAEGPEGRYYSRGSVIIVDELATNEPGSLTKGLGWTVPKLADAIKEMCKRWKIDAAGPADDSIFAKGGHSQGSISDEFQRCDVHFHPAQKHDR